MLIREEHPGDCAAIREVNRVAFEGDAEAQLVDALRKSGVELISLVAEEQGEIVGHILFSPVGLDGHPELTLFGLAPMAVLPVWQNRGVGSALVREGLERCRAQGVEAVVVLGHPAYYPRFGFKSSSEYAIASEYDVPPEVFMVLELVPGCLAQVHGTVHYHGAFAAV